MHKRHKKVVNTNTAYEWQRGEFIASFLKLRVDVYSKGTDNHLNMAGSIGNFIFRCRKKEACLYVGCTHRVIQYL